MAGKNDTPQKAAMRELYDMDISDSTVSRITDKILPIVKEWQESPLEVILSRSGETPDIHDKYHRRVQPAAP